jgi:hypothetical protein
MGSFEVRLPLVLIERKGGSHSRAVPGIVKDCTANSVLQIEVD